MTCVWECGAEKPEVEVVNERVAINQSFGLLRPRTTKKSRKAPTRSGSKTKKISSSTNSTHHQFVGVLHCV